MRGSATTVLMLCTMATWPAAAQQPPKPPAAEPAKPATPGEPMPFAIPYGLSIGVDEAGIAIDAAEAEARKRGWAMCIAVVDTHGELVRFSRMDDAQIVSTDISQRKARTAARWRRETRVFFEAYKTSTIYGTVDPQLAASPGGIPIVADGRIVGAIGCSGGTSDQDVIVCQAGLDALK